MKKSIVLLAAVCFVFAACSTSKTKTEAVKSDDKAAAAEAVKPVYNLTIITSDEHVAGGEDFMLTDAIRQSTGAELNKKVVNYKDAVASGEYTQANLSYIPVYILERNEDTYKKLEPFIQNGVLKDTAKGIIFERQTRYGIYVNEPVKKNTLEVFVMSQCPYGAMAENTILEAMKNKTIGKDIKIKLRYIASLQQMGEGVTFKETFRSLHGSAEWEEDVRQLLIAKYYPSLLWKYLEIRNKDYQSSLWPEALQKAGIPMDKINKEFNTTGKALLKADIEYGEKFGANASPTYLWEGRILGDARSLSNIKGLEFLAPKPQAPGTGAPAVNPNGSC